MRTLSVTLAAVTLAGALLWNGCGKKDQSDAQQSARDSVSAAALPVDTTSVPTVFTDSTRVELKFRVRPGEVYHFHEVVASNSEGTFNDIPSKAQEESNYYFTMTMQGMQRDSMVHAVFIFDSVTVKMSTDQNVKQFRSNDTTQMKDPQNALYSSLIGVPIHLTIAHSGEIVRADSVDIIAGKIIASSPQKDKITPDQRRALTEQITDGAIKAVAQHVFSHFTDGPVGKNSTWDSRFNSMADVFPTENTVTYTLASFNQNGANRSATIGSSLGVKVMQKKLEDSTATVTLKSSAFSGGGSTDIDLVRGITIHKDVHLSMKVEISAKGHGAYAARAGEIKKTMNHQTTLDRY